VGTEQRNCRPWVKYHADALDSIQLQRAGELAENLFGKLMLLIGTDGHGDTLRWTPAEIAWRLHKTEKDIRRRLDALEREGLAVVTDTSVTLTGWNERQNFRTEAERKREERDRKKQGDMSRTCHGHVTDAARDMSQKSHALEGKKEEVRTNTQPHLVRETAPPMPPDGRARVIAKTDEDLKPLLAAWNRATGDSLGWSAKYVLPCERIYAQGGTAENVERAARAYLAALSDGTPRSFTRTFATDFDRWLSIANAPAPKRERPPDNPKLGAPSGARAVGWCPKHPGIGLTREGCSTCRNEQAGASP
jgi:hypothetical protein